MPPETHLPKLLLRRCTARQGCTHIHTSSNSNNFLVRHCLPSPGLLLTMSKLQRAGCGSGTLAAISMPVLKVPHVASACAGHAEPQPEMKACAQLRRSPWPDRSICSKKNPGALCYSRTRQATTCR